MYKRFLYFFLVIIIIKIDVSLSSLFYDLKRYFYPIKQKIKKYKKGIYLPASGIIGTMLLSYIIKKFNLNNVTLQESDCHVSVSNDMNNDLDNTTNSLGTNSILDSNSSSDSNNSKSNNILDRNRNHSSDSSSASLDIITSPLDNNKNDYKYYPLLLFGFLMQFKLKKKLAITMPKLFFNKNMGTGIVNKDQCKIGKGDLLQDAYSKNNKQYSSDEIIKIFSEYEEYMKRRY